jgi:S1-C subfamily serine protease
MADLAYAHSFPPFGSATLTGKSTHQQIRITSQWVTSADPECCAVRNYSETVGWKVPRPTKPYGGTGSYTVTSTTKSWLGVYAVVEYHSSSTAPSYPTVFSVVPGSPAATVLKPGDELVGVAGVTLPSGAGVLGPPVIDQVAAGMPGTMIALSIIRGGVQRVVNVTLSSRANPAYIAAKDSPPVPGYLGVEVRSDNPGLVSKYGLGTAAGAVIAKVESNGPAASAGLSSRDVIVSFGGAQVLSATDLETAIAESPPGTSAQVAYIGPSGNAHTVNVTVGAASTSGIAI